MHEHIWHYSNYATLPNKLAGLEPDTILGFVCDCGAMKKVKGFEYMEPKPIKKTSK